HTIHSFPTRRSSDLKKVAQLCRQYQAYFHSDTVQTVGHYAFDVRDLDIDFMTCSAHKFHGPKGIGFLFVNENLQLKPIITGGAQDRKSTRLNSSHVK